jgi:predicted alpha/beta superfamily hydrolase
LTTHWQLYMEGKDPALHSVVGAVRVAKDVYSPQLQNRRDILVYLPPSYHDEDRAYPVIYMHDGQNLFDRATSYVGEWEVDETLENLAQTGLEAIIVGIPNMGAERISEYSPYDNRWGKARGEQYVSFITDTAKPLVDASFRTLPQREHTGIAGSSMGGLISLYGYLRRPEIFGFTGVMSPAFWITGGKIFDLAESLPHLSGRIYLDIGAKEISWRRGATKTFTNAVKQMYALLVSKGYLPNEQILYIEDPDGIHHESSWKQRLPGMLRFLLHAQPQQIR